MKYLGFLLIAVCFGSPLQAQVVNVTAAFDSTNLVIGGATTLRVFGHVNEFNRSAADQILAWYLDLINFTPATARADYATLQRRFSDNDSRTSSPGKTEGGNQRGIFDTFLNTAGAGMTNRIELLSCTVTALAAGKVIFGVAPGTTVGNLSTDFLVALKADSDPLAGGVYSRARAELLVGAGAVETSPVILQVSYSALPGAFQNRVALSFNVTSGRNFFLEVRDQLSSASEWLTFPGGPHNAGSYVDTNSVPSRFYRVRW